MNTSFHARNRHGKSVTIFNDRVMVLMMFLSATLLVADKNQAVESFHFTIKALIHISPFFLLAILFAAYAKASGADQLIARAFSGNTINGNRGRFTGRRTFTILLMWRDSFNCGYACIRCPFGPCHGILHFVTDHGP
jgi:hypothetical protein